MFEQGISCDIWNRKVLKRSLKTFQNLNMPKLLWLWRLPNHSDVLFALL